MTRQSIQKLVKKRAGIQLDVGCGDHKQSGFVGMDKRRLKGVDIVHDLERTPWPLPDNCCTAVVLSHVWEHITPNRTLDVMAEIHRISRHDGIVMMAGPYGMGFRFVQDPTHVCPVNEATFCYFDPINPSGLWGVYKPPPLHVERFLIVPAGSGDRDFEAALRVCKQFKNGACPHVLNGQVQSKSAHGTNRGSSGHGSRRRKH